MNGTLARSCGIALGLLVAACGAPTSSPRAEPPPTVTRSPAAESEAPSPEATATLPSVGPAPQLSVIFDDDGSPDGTTALLYLLSHPRVSLEAVNISYGRRTLGSTSNTSGGCLRAWAGRISLSARVRTPRWRAPTSSRRGCENRRMTFGGSRSRMPARFIRHRTRLN